MARAGELALNKVEALLAAARLVPGVVERKRGIFYLKGTGFLHFHEDADGIFADIKLDLKKDFVRMRVSTAAERQAFLKSLKKSFLS